MKYLLGEKLQLDWKLAVVNIVSVTLLITDQYRTITAYKYWDRFILYLLIPLAITIIFFRENPKGFGFSFGEWKLGVIYTLIGIGFMTPILWLLGHRDASMQEYYKGLVISLPWTTFLDLIGWEFFFRGWILFAYARKFGPEALWLQAIPFALAHIGKPEIETLSTIFGGFAFGWIAYRTKSFVYPFLIHWFIATFVILVAAGKI